MNRVFIFLMIPVLCLMWAYPAWSQDRSNPADAPVVDEKFQATAQRLLGEAWKRYNAGDYSRATDLFELAAKADRAEIRQEATLGLAYVHLKQKRYENAGQILQKLVDEGYKLEETGPVLLKLLADGKEWTKAGEQLKRLPPELQEEWREKLRMLEADAARPGPTQDLTDGWKALNEGKNDQARKLFNKASGSANRDIQNEARLGLAYVHWKMGQSGKARELFEALSDDGYRLDEVLPSLAEILIGQKDWPAADRIVSRLPDRDQKKFREKIAKALEAPRPDPAGEALAEGWALYNRGALKSALSSFQVASRGPKLRNNADLGMAYTYQKLGFSRKALELFQRLAQKGYKRKQTVPACLELLFKTGNPEAARQFMSSLPDNAQARYQEIFLRLELADMKRRLALHDPDTLEYRELAQRILDRDPGDDAIRAALGWSCHRAKEFGCALEHFRFLQKKSPQKEEYLVGLGYTLMDLNNAGEALELLESWAGSMSPDLVKIKGLVLTKLGQDAFDLKEFPTAEMYFTRALALDSDNMDIKEQLAWSLFEQGRLDEAIPIFREIYERKKSPTSAKNVLQALKKGECRDEINRFAAELAAERSCPALNKIAGDYYYERGQVIRAAQTYDGEDACYRNCDSTRIEANPSYRYKDGDSGLSRLHDASVPLFFHLPTRQGREWVLGVTTHYLDAGRPPDNPYAGQYFRYIDNPANRQNDLVDTAVVWTPELRFRYEGDYDYQIRLGSTPLGGPVGALPTFSIDAEDSNNWRFNLHQCAVDKSMQSYVGQKDPYSGRTWGRVARSGLEAQKTFQLRQPYWISIAGGYDYYWGHNVIENHQYRGSVSVGRTDELPSGQLTAGVFSTAEHFKHNTDFYTFGHGGYFSPRLFLMAGPFVRYKSNICCDYFLDIQASVGYMYYETDDAPRYHRVEDDWTALNAGARSDFQSRYMGEEKSGVGLNIKLNAMKLVNEHLAFGVSAGLNTSSDYYEYNGALRVQLFFEPVQRICPFNALSGNSGNCP